MSDRLFRPPPRFEGLPPDGFRVFSIEDPQERRKEIIRRLHPPLRLLGEDLVGRLEAPLHIHLPRLDWPRGYQPFCTWLALSRLAQGYQAGPQLNVGVHAGYVAIRLGWDSQAASFGRFEFLATHAGLGDEMERVAGEEGLAFRVYASAPWPEGSRCVHQSAQDWKAAFEEVGRRGVWFELGVRRNLPEAASWVGSSAMGEEAYRVFRALMPLYDRLAGHAITNQI